MTISELIAELQKILDEHGDVEVLHDGPLADSDVEDVRYVYACDSRDRWEPAHVLIS